MTIVKEFKISEVFPDVLDECQLHLLEVFYNSGVQVQPNEQLTPTEVKDKPTVDYIAENGAFYTLLLTDPDAPSRSDPRFREVWISQVTYCKLNSRLFFILFFKHFVCRKAFHLKIKVLGSYQFYANTYSYYVNLF